MFIMSAFLALPFLIRVVVFLFILLIIWRISGKGLLWILSFIPFLLKIFFIVLYKIVELPIVMLHKKLGGYFGKIDNFMAGFGKKVDRLLIYWYDAWHSKYKFRWGKAIVAYSICLVIIGIPSFSESENNVLKSGETLYKYFENRLTNFLERHEWDGFTQDDLEGNSKYEESDKEEFQESEIELVVSGVSSSLLVRDIPDIENGVVLERLYNADKVVWTGELVFAEAENNHVETWVKVITGNGVEGWSRMFYLSPEEYRETEYFVKSR